MSGGKLVLVILGILLLLGCGTAGGIVLAKTTNKILGYSLIAGGVIAGAFCIAMPIVTGGPKKTIPKGFQTRYEMVGGAQPQQGMICTTCHQPIPAGTTTCPRCSKPKGPIQKTRAYEAPAPQGLSQGWLQVVHGVDRGMKVQFTPQGLSIGRGASNYMVLNDQGASQTHCQLVNTNNSLVLVDVGSGNGTFLNEQRVTTPVPIKAGDIIRIGNTRIQVLDPQLKATPS